MSYFNQLSITLADNSNADAFQRLRVSDPYTIFDSKQLYDTGSLVWATKTIGNATASFVTNNAGVLMVSSGSNTAVIRQTKKRHVYQPGKSQLIITTGNFSGSSAGVIKRMGYFDGNNGVGFMVSGSSFGTFIRTNTSGTPVTTFVSQSAWNLDKYDGTGVSGKSINISKSQIYFMDFEWLGVGRVRYGIFQGGIPTYVHQITNANVLDSVYMSTPNLPIRYELINSGSTTASMFHICSTVSSEGGLVQNGSIRGVSNTTNLGYTAGNQYGSIAIRLKSGSLDGNVIPLNSNSSQTAAASIYEVALLLNPSGSLPWVWQDIPNSIVQFATASSNAYTIAIEGTKISSDFGQATTANAANFDPTLAIGSDVDGVQDILVLAVRAVSGNPSNFNSSLNWREL
jgi:hypothetical protein